MDRVRYQSRQAKEWHKRIGVDLPKNAIENVNKIFAI